MTVARARAKLPVIPTPTGSRFQPIDATEVAQRMAELALGEPSSLVPDLAGPKIYTAAELVKSYLRAAGTRRPLVPVHIPGQAAQALRAGANLAPDRAAGPRRQLTARPTSCSTGVNTDGAYWHAIVSGVIGDYGPAVSISPNGQVDPAHNSELDLRLAHGSFRLGIAALDKTFVKAASHEPSYPKTCSDLLSVTGTTRIVAGSGTGAYRGIRGSFPVTLTLGEVEARPCQPSPGALRAQLITVAGSGTVSF